MRRTLTVPLPSAYTVSTLACFALGAIAVQQPACRAALVTYTASADPNASPDANGNTVNVWSVNPSGSGVGSYLGNSATNGDGNGAGAGNPAWTIYAANNSAIYSFATVSLLTDRPLSVAGDYLSIDFDNGPVNGVGRVGISLINNNGAIQTTFSFTGNDTHYEIVDSTQTTTGLALTDDGFNLKFTLNNSSGGYTLQAGAMTFSGRSFTQSSSNISYVRIFNEEAGSGSARELFFNNLTLSTVPEVSAASAIPVALLVAGTAQSIIRRKPKRVTRGAHGGSR